MLVFVKLLVTVSISMYTICVTDVCSAFSADSGALQISIIIIIKWLGLRTAGSMGRSAQVTEQATSTGFSSGTTIPAVINQHYFIDFIVVVIINIFLSYSGTHHHHHSHQWP